MGANWIHGANQANCVFNLANKYKLIDLPLKIVNRRMGAFINSDGEAIDQKLSLEIFDRIREIEYETMKLKQEPGKQTFAQFMDEKVKELIDTYSPDDQKIAYRVYNYFRNYMSFHAGDDINLVSAWGYGAYNEIPDDVTVSGGFVQIVNKIAEEVGSNNIYLNHQVVEINWESDPISIKVKTLSNDAQIIRANYVIVTTSLGVIKAYHKHLFNPNLPTNKVDAINRMGFGRVGKIFLHFSSPFWQPGTLGNLKFARDDDDFKIGNHWSYRINGFEEVENNPNVIQAWVSGAETQQLELDDDNAILDGCTRILRQFTGDPSIPRPDSVLKTNWCTNPFIRGSYSFPTTKSLADDYETIADPLPNKYEPRLLFAGEATIRGYFSTVHGARASGMREAERIIKLNRSQSKL